MSRPGSNLASRERKLAAESSVSVSCRSRVLELARDHQQVDRIARPSIDRLGWRHLGPRSTRAWLQIMASILQQNFATRKAC
jgi:hypothetical protein